MARRPTVVVGLLGVVLCALVLAPAAWAQTPPCAQRQDVVYADVHGTGLLMDVFVPTTAPNGLGIIDVVSGAWHSDRGKIRDHQRARVFDEFCARGFTVFGVRPGSRTRYTLTDMDRHVKLAIRHVKTEARGYGIDPARLGLIGASAGGHLATLAALTPEPASGGSGNSQAMVDTSVRAVAVFFPPTDFLDWRDGQMADPALLAGLLYPAGAALPPASEVREEASRMSPRHRIAPTDVPFLVIHGDADPLVPIEQSRRFVAALEAARVPATLIVKPGGGHPWPTLPDEVRVMADWMLAQLRE